MNVLMLFSIFSVPAVAHHSTAMFDPQAERVFTGVVTKFAYINPHSWLYVDIKNEDGTVTNWGFEVGAAPRLRRMGVSPSFWKKGDLVRVRAYPLKNGRPAGSLRGAITSEGKTFRDVEDLTAPTND